MKITVACVFIINYALMVDSLVIPPNDEGLAPKETIALLNKSSTHPVALPWHNADLSKASKSEVQAAEMEETSTDHQESETEEKTFLRNTRQIIYNCHDGLQWVDWPGSVPTGAVSINNQFTGRTDYVCSVSNCATGFYSKDKGSYCYYSNDGREYRASSFKILINNENIEFIQWLPASFGSVPANPVGRCSGVYVGKNQYGLGKVVPSSSVLFLPFNGNEYTYDYYEVLILNMNYYSQALTAFSYLTGQADFYKEDIEVLTSTKVINNACHTLSRTVSLTKTVLIEKYWNIGRSTKKGVTTIITSSIPSISKSSVSLPSALQFEWQEGSPYMESRTNTYSLSVTISPQHECEIVLEGRKVQTEIPFSSSLTRYFQDAKIHSATIKGIFSNIQIDYVTISLGQCKRITNAPPC